MITLQELAETYNLVFSTVAQHSSRKEFEEFFTVADMPTPVKKRGKNETHIVYRKRICIPKDKIEKYLKFKENFAKHSETFLGWTNASAFCFKRGMNCQGCDLWEINCKQRAKECYKRTPPIKEKVLELVRDYGEPPKFLLDRV